MAAAGSYTDSGVAPGTHSYQVAASDSAGTSPESAAVSVTVAAAAPGPVTGLRAVVRGSTVTLSWTNPANTQGDDIYENGNEIAWPGWPNPVVTSYQVTGLANGKYTFAVAAYDGSGLGPDSTTVTVFVGGLSWMGIINLNA